MKKSIIMIMAALMAFAVSSFAGPKKKVELKEVTFSVSLHCNNCVKKVQENIAFEKGVKDLHVCLEDQIVYVKYDAAKTSEEKLKAAIEKLGYPVAGKVEQEGGHSHDGDHKHDDQDHAAAVN